MLPIDPPTPFVHYVWTDQPKGRVLVIHGLDASKENMSLISAALADGGFQVYAIDLPGHGDSQAAFRADVAEQAILQAKKYLGGDTIVLGHSLGAGLLLDVAATEHFSTMVLLAPPPMPVEEIRADRVLIATGDIDVPRIRSFLPLVADIGSPHSESWLLPWAAHSSPIFSPPPIRRVVEWLGGDGTRVMTVPRIFWILLMFAAACAIGVGFLSRRELAPINLSVSSICAAYVISYGAALFAMKIARPLFGWMHLFAADYLIGFLLIAGLVLLLSVKEKPAVMDRYSIGTALLAAAFTIAVPGFLVASRLAHLYLSGGRWWRFPVIVLAGLPMLIADETLIRRIGSRWKSECVALLMHGLLFAVMLTGVLTLNRESAFLLMILPIVLIFWTALWFAAGAVHRHTQSAGAAGLFAAIVQGWFFAAFFVTM